MWIPEKQLVGKLFEFKSVSHSQIKRAAFSNKKIQRTIAQAASSDQAIKLGSVIWHREGQVERGAFEHISFAEADSIKSTCRKFLKYELKKSGITSELLQEFGKICELRHGIVHSNSFLAGKNAIKLEIPNEAPTHTLKIMMGYEQLQECGLICTMLIASFNTEMFEEMAKRWAVDWPKLPSWNPAKANTLFKQIWLSFYSKVDEQDKKLLSALAKVALKGNILPKNSLAAKATALFEKLKSKVTD